MFWLGEGRGWGWRGRCWRGLILSVMMSVKGTQHEGEREDEDARKDKRK